MRSPRSRPSRSSRCRAVALAVFAVGASWAQAAEPAPAPAPSEAVVQRCGAPVMGMEEVLAPGAVVLLGGLPGTREAPAFVGTLACHVASAGQPVVVGLELPHEEQASLERYLESDGGREARAALTVGPFWRRPYQDGRGSEAMVALLEKLRGWHAQGLRVSVLAYNAPGQGSARSAAMAPLVLRAHRAAPASTFLLLGGNVHLRTARGAAWDETFTPLGWHLVRAGLPVRALDMRYSQGTAWMCNLGEEESEHSSLSCETQPAVPPPHRRTDKVIYRGRRPFVELAPTRTLEGFDGVFYVGPITASPPAVRLTTDGSR